MGRVPQRVPAHNTVRVTPPRAPAGWAPANCPPSSCLPRSNWYPCCTPVTFSSTTVSRPPGPELTANLCPARISATVSESPAVCAWSSAANFSAGSTRIPSSAALSALLPAPSPTTTRVGSLRYRAGRLPAERLHCLVALVAGQPGYRPGEHDGHRRSVGLG